METMFLHEVPLPARRLGRHVRHDPRSWGFPAPMAGQIASVRHTRHVPVWDQGSVGSCTGQAAVGCIGTGPFTHAGTASEALEVYSHATSLDDIAGTYPPTDTGSSGLAVMKALQARSLIQGFTHAFDLNSTLRALMLRPGITGIAWREGCDTPDANGIVRYTGLVRGGHEVVIEGLDWENKLVWLCNSWGSGWGFGGAFAMTVSDYAKALADHGDATFPLV